MPVFTSHITVVNVTTETNVPMVQQVSFNVGTLANVKRTFRKVREAQCKVIEPRCHGNAWSVYFSDPEGNRVEIKLRRPRGVAMRVSNLAGGWPSQPFSFTKSIFCFTLFLSPLGTPE